MFNFSDSINTSSLTSTNGTSFSVPIGPQVALMSDIDGDGIPELILSSYETNMISVYPNTSVKGAISFNPGSRTDFTTGDRPSELVVADIDGDGLLDMVTSNYGIADTLGVYHPGTYSVFLNTTASPGAFTFATRIDSTVGHNPSGLAVGDLDGDGRPDIVVVTQGDADIAVCRNNSSVGHVLFDSPITVTFGGGAAHSAAIIDLDGDGKPEVLVSDPDSRVIHILQNNSSLGTISLAESGTGLGGELSQKRALLFVAAADLDLDGKPDVISTDTLSHMLIWPGASSGTGNFNFGTAQEFIQRDTAFTDTNRNVGAIALGDINGDGKPDIVVANSFNNSIGIFQNKSTSGVIELGSRKDISGLGTYPIRPVLSDVDGDTHPDLGLPGYDSDDILFLHNEMKDGFVRANLRAILQGPFSSAADSMSRTLNSGGYLASYFTSTSFPSLTVDSVNIELRDSSSASKSNIRRFAPSWLMTNGSIRHFVDTLKSFVEFDTISPGPYYLVIRHRNHLGIMSSSAVNLTASGTFYDFTTGQGKAFGTNPMIQVGSRFCLYAGDANSDGQITTLDFTPWLSAARSALTGYRGTDFNCDGQNTTQDFTMWLANARSAASSHIP
jgi:hypothetical protein